MSRSKPRGGSSSPFKKYIEYRGGEGIFQYYNRDTRESQEVEINDIVVLDVRHSITGYSRDHSASIGSNMVGNLSNEELNVVAYTKSGVQNIAKGLYKDIKAELREVNGKFTTNVIALADVGDGKEIVVIQLSGTGNSSWISFTGEHGDFYDYALTMERGALSKLDANNKAVPVSKKEEDNLNAKLKKNPRAPRPVWFHVVDITKSYELSEEEADEANEADEKVQAYFDTLNGKTKNDSDQEGSEKASEEAYDEEESDDLPF